jgi:UPF0755 protein
MTSDLGLFPLRPGGDPDDEQRRMRVRNRWIRRGITLVVCLALLAGLLRLVSIGRDQLVDNFSPNRDWKTPGAGVAIVEVAQKATLKQVGAALVKAKVVRTSGAFQKAFAKQTTLTKVEPGYYQLKLHMSAASAVALLLTPSAKLPTKVTIPEGTPLTKVLSLIAKGTSLQPDALTQATATPAALDLPTWATPTTVEGFLYPATYQFDPRADAVAAMQQMVAKFDDEAYSLDLQDSKTLVHHTPYEVLTIASIIEKEALKRTDYPKVARVLYNRLAQHMKLQVDSTLNYVLPERKGHLSKTDLQIASPYNTYLHKGLPPTPIDSPGSEALKAALAPAEGNWTFFITLDKQGTMDFTNNYVQFQNDKKTARANGVIP